MKNLSKFTRTLSNFIHIKTFTRKYENRQFWSKIY